VIFYKKQELHQQIFLGNMNLLWQKWLVFLSIEQFQRNFFKIKKKIAVRTLILAFNLVETYTHQFLFQLPNMFSSDEEFVHYVSGLFLFTLDFCLPKKSE